MRAVVQDDYLEFELRVLGVRQARNALLAVATARHLLPQLSKDTICRALSEVRIPGRTELFAGDPPVIIDGAHTPESISFLLETVAQIYPPPYTLLFGTLQGKKHQEMARRLIPSIGRVYIVRPGSFRKSNLEELASPFTAAHIPTTIVEEAPEALQYALTEECGSNCILVTGSFYLAGLLRREVTRRRSAAGPSQ